MKLDPRDIPSLVASRLPWVATSLNVRTARTKHRPAVARSNPGERRV